MFNFSTVEGAQCYVCSWSPSDTYRADLCTRGNFSDSVRTTKCEHGCESVTVFDKNGMWTTSVGCVTRSSIVFEPGEMTQFYKGETPNHLVRLGLEPKPKRQFASSLTRRKIGSPHPVRKQIRSPCPAINTVNATTGFHINFPPPPGTGKMDFFYRNCVQEAAVAVKGTQANHHHHQQSRSCWNETSKTISKEICMCYSDYCNGASLSTSDKFVMVSAMLAAYIALSHSSMEFFWVLSIYQPFLTLQPIDSARFSTLLK